MTDTEKLILKAIDGLRDGRTVSLYIEPIGWIAVWSIASEPTGDLVRLLYASQDTSALVSRERIIAVRMSEPDDD